MLTFQSPRLPQENILLAIALVSVTGLLLAKFWLILKINVSWDEFFMLSLVHDLAHGRLSSPVQTLLTQPFSWLTAIPGHEIAQIHAARFAATGLLALSALLLYLLARTWATPLAAAAALLGYLATLPVLRHGGSFRADAVLLLLVLLAALLLARRPRSLNALVVVGVAMGTAVAVTVKATLFFPMLAALFFASAWGSYPSTVIAVRESTRGLLVIGCCGIVTAIALLALHACSLPPATDGEIGTILVGAARTTLFGLPWLPQGRYLENYLAEDTWTWGLMAVGALVCVARRKWAPASLALALTPVLFYRNSFPYFYVVMLAPAAILISIAFDELQLWMSHRFNTTLRHTIITLLLLTLLVQAYSHLGWLRSDKQAVQRATIDAVHTIFPEPVAYIDHSGMIASYPKANFFMTTWGMELYRQSGRDFMPEVLDKYRPPMLLANHSVLRPGSLRFSGLTKTDQELIRRFYVDYWGAIKVAGVRAVLDRDVPAILELPFPGQYRLISNAAVVVEGETVLPGQVVPAVGNSLEVLYPSGTDSTPRIEIRLVWADAAPPPKSIPPGAMYQSL